MLGSDGAPSGSKSSSARRMLSCRRSATAALFRNATFVLEVAARRPLIEIQHQFPNLFKVGPNTKMNEIVHAHLAGRPARASADAAAANPRHHRSRLFLSRPQIAAVAGVQHRQLDRHAFLGRLAGS